MNTIRIELTKPRHFLNPFRVFSPNKNIKYIRKTPASWAEMTKKQLNLTAQAMLSAGKDDKNIHRELILSFLKIPFRNIKYMNISQLNDIAVSINFIFDKSSLINNPVPVLHLSRHFYHGPEEKIKNLTFNQFIFADTIFLRYIKTQDETLLQQLISVLYFQKDTSFIPDLIEKRAKIFRRVNQRHQLLILLFYISSRNYLTNANPYLFPKSNTQSKKSDNFSWADTVFELVGDKPADKDKIEKLDLYFAIGYLNRKAELNSKNTTS